MTRLPITIKSRATSASRPRGFTLVEILIVVVLIGILAMMVVPAYLRASQPALDNVLRENLRSMRTQIELFTGQHGGLPPGYPNGDRGAAPTAAAFVAQMTQYSSEAGTTSPTYSASTPIGPYLTYIPKNPFNDLDAVRVLGDSESVPAADGVTYGWFYKPFTKQFVANTPGSDESGRAYSDY
jgi:prepilin-type N-terminal cleavage/methylation domain-containing protein